MSDDRLPTSLWVSAHLRLCSSQGVSATVLHRGDPDRGVVIQKLRRFDGRCALLRQETRIDGGLSWAAAFDGALRAEADADAYIARACAQDPDLWVVE
ncbi:MAG: DUF1491 family protein, partial [Pseudomonadota bacterium]